MTSTLTSPSHPKQKLSFFGNVLVVGFELLKDVFNLSMGKIGKRVYNL